MLIKIFKIVLQKYWGLDFRRNGDLVNDAFGQYSTELFTSEAENIINNHNSSQVSYIHITMDLRL